MSTEMNAGPMGSTTISVPDELADELYDKKERGETYADVIWRLLEESDETNREDEPAPVDTAQTQSTHKSSPQSMDDLIEDIGREVLPGSGEKLEERVAALRASVEYLQERGTATPSDFQEDVYPDHKARYTTGEDPQNSWWKNCVYKGLSELAERTDTIASADTSGEWTYKGDFE